MDKKKREKKIKSPQKQKEKHIEKRDSYEGKNYALKEYWTKEIDRMDREIAEEKDKLNSD